MADHAALDGLPKDHWIHGALAKTKKGGLHKNLHIPQGQPIPAKKMAMAMDSKKPVVRKEAQMAKNMEGDHEYR